MNGQARLKDTFHKSICIKNVYSLAFSSAELSIHRLVYSMSILSLNFFFSLLFSLTRVGESEYSLNNKEKKEKKREKNEIPHNNFFL